MVLPLWVVENHPFPLLSPLAYTTACTVIQAIIIVILGLCSLTYHGLHGSAGTVLTAITLSYGKWRNSTPQGPHRIKTPSLVDMKLWTYDYVQEICPQIYFCKNPWSRGFWQEWWNITSQFFFISPPFFSQKRLRVTPVDRCSRAVTQKTWNHSRKCLLGVRTLKLISTFYIIAKTVKILAKTGLGFFDWTLNSGVVQE